MSIDPARYRPPFASERLLPPHPVHGYQGCRFSAAWMGSAIATLGESTMTPHGRVKGRLGRRRDLARMLAGTGEPDRPGFNQDHVPGIHRAIDMPVPELWEGTFDELWADGHAAWTIAGNVDGFDEASKLRAMAVNRGWLTADHELLLTQHRRTRDGIDQALVYDPMHEQSDRYAGDWVPKAELRRFLRPFGVMAERYPVGGWTAAAEVKRRLDRTVERLERRLADCRERLTAAEATVEALHLELAECREHPPVDCSAARAAARERALVAARDAIDALRTEAP